MDARVPAALAAVAALALAGCGDDDGGDGETAAGGATTSEATAPAGYGQAPAPEPGAEPAKGTTVKVSGSDFGPILFDGSDQAIYLFDKEGGAKSECYGECAEAWPPVLTEGDPRAGGGADAALLGTTERDDGTTQVTYGGHPLYYYAHEGPGEVTCHDVEEFGGLWLVVKPNGDPVS